MAISFKNEYRTKSNHCLKIDISIDDECTDDVHDIMVNIHFEQDEVIIGDTLIRSNDEEKEFANLKNLSTTIYTSDGLEVFKQSLKDIIDTIDKFQKQIKN